MMKSTNLVCLQLAILAKIARFNPCSYPCTKRPDAGRKPAVRSRASLPRWLTVSPNAPMGLNMIRPVPAPGRSTRAIQTIGNEIGDICQNSTATLSGVTVQAYWSQQDNACLIPQAPSLRKTLSLARITLGGQGLRSIQGVIPSLNAFVDQLYGSTL
jgi:hypothetical protein